MRQLARNLAVAAPATASSRQASSWWAVFRDLRDARSAYGLKARHLTTLAALLTFLPEGDEEMIVFASNRTILERLNGLCERTFQRHVGELCEAGLVRRNDSSNGKRFRMRRSAEMALSYGFDLSPLIEQASPIAEAAQAQRHRAAHVAMLRQQILKRLANRDEIALSPSREAELRLFLRRDQSVEALNELLNALQTSSTSPEEVVSEEATSLAKTTNLSASNRHFVGHHHKSKENDIDKDTSSVRPDTGSKHPSEFLEKLRKACPTSSEWLSKGLSTWREIFEQLQQLASWAGISGAVYAKAEHQNGPEKTGTTLLAILESADRIKHPAAYFYAVTLGQRAASFSTEILLNRLTAAQPCHPWMTS